MMTKLQIIFLALFFCSSALAEQVVLVCEVPAEQGKKASPLEVHIPVGLD